MTRGIRVRALVGSVGLILFGAVVVACAGSSGSERAIEPPTATSTTSIASTGTASTATTSDPTLTPASAPKPRPRPSKSTRITVSRHVAPATPVATPSAAPVTRRPAAPSATPRPSPPPSTHRVSPSPAPRTGCDPSYPSVCLKDGIGDYDCAGGSGNGPNYVQGPIVVRSPDPFRLDADHDGIGCE